jgi:glutathione transport system ATP-binding protein
MMEPALELNRLSVTYPVRGGTVPAVREASLRLERGTTLGLLGESGSGKSSIALAALGLLPPGTRVTGSVRCMGAEVLGQPERELARLRGTTVAYVPQDPLTCLNPAFTVGWQIAEAVRSHQHVSRASARERARHLMELAGLPGAADLADRYPHELSGGMCQRVVVAMAIANDPDVIVADEPTSTLDVTIQAQVLEALRAARAQVNAALLLISHDLGVIARLADMVAVMYAGCVVETGPAAEVFADPRMPYTRGLFGSHPRLGGDRTTRLQPVPGHPPSLLDLGPGCSFVPRCPLASQRCQQAEPGLEPVRPGHLAACHFAAGPAHASSGRASPPPGPPAVPRADRPVPDDQDGADVTRPVLEVSGLVKHFAARTGRLTRGRPRVVHAVCGVSFQVRAGETLGLVGESGSGKSTTARSIAQLLRVTAGSVRCQGQELTTRSRSEMVAMRRQLQIVFQDPGACLDPRMPAGETVAEPLRVQGLWDRLTGPGAVDALLRTVGLDPAHRNRYPHELSGGQQQRVGIARSLALRPAVMILDEPVSALDVSVQAGIINLLADLRDQFGLAYLFISHDLAVIRHLCDRVAVMYLGRIVETGLRDSVFGAPVHPYTQALLSAALVADPAAERRRSRILLAGEVPSAAAPPSGCRFRSRCWKAQAVCAEQEPALARQSDGHLAACHFADRAPAPPRW